jgi:hypothetical protein
MNLAYSTKRLLKTNKEQIFVRHESNSDSNDSWVALRICEGCVSSAAHYIRNTNRRSRLEMSLSMSVSLYSKARRVWESGSQITYKVRHM